MSELEFQVLRGAGFVVAVGLAAGLQRWSPHTGWAGSWRVNLRIWLLNLVVMGLVCGACACAVARWASQHEFGLLNSLDLPIGAAIAISVFALDGVSYVWHRANHTLPFLWRFHQVHHSDARFTISTGVRFHPGELVLSLPLRLTAVALLGAPIVGVIVFELAFALVNLIEHGDIDIPRRFESWMERIIITPALHRRHHGKQGAQYGTNFGTIFSVWDRLLGSYGASTSAARIDIGLPGLRPDLGLASTLKLPISRERAPAPR